MALPFLITSQTNPLRPLNRTSAGATFSGRDLLRWHQYRPAAKKRQFLNSRLPFAQSCSGNSGREPKASSMIPILTDVLLCCRLRKATSLTSVCHIPVSVTQLPWQFRMANTPVGVDIQISDSRRADALRWVALHPHEQGWCDLATRTSPEALITLWTIKESVWKTLHEMRNTPFAEVSVSFDVGIPKPCILNDSPETPSFRTQLFVHQCVPVVPGTVCLPTGNVALRGCVTQRLPPRKQRTVR